MCAPQSKTAWRHRPRWEEPKGMSMWNEQANEKVPWANEKGALKESPARCTGIWNELGDTGKRHFMIETLL